MRKGTKHTEEAKRKMSLANIGNTKHLGYKHSDEAKRKIGKSNSKALKGKYCGKDNPLFGKKQTNEHKRKLSEAHKDKKLSEETRRKISKARKNKKHTKEAKLKISLAKRGKNHPNWRGGTCKEPYCPEFTQDLKEFIKKRDGYKCMAPLCDKKITKKNPLGVHHIDYDKKNCMPENLISNCRSCNFIANFNRDEWKEIYWIVIKQNYNY